MEENEQIEQQQKELTFKQKLSKLFFKKENASTPAIVIASILNVIILVVFIASMLLVFGWGKVAKPAADLSIKNALSVKSFSATLLKKEYKNANNFVEKEAYTVKYCKGIYCLINQNSIQVWSFNDDGRTIKYLKNSYNENAMSEQEALDAMRDVSPQILSISDIGENLYLLNRAITVDTSDIIWMGSIKTTLFGLMESAKKQEIDNISYCYGAQIELPNASMVCTAAYQLNTGLKLCRMEFGWTNGYTINSAVFNISKQGKSNFDFKFKD